MNFFKVILQVKILLILLNCSLVSMISSNDSVKPIKVDCAKDKSGNCINCPKGTIIAAIVEKGKEIMGCYKCPKDTAAIGVINHNFTCGKCPKGTVLKKIEQVPGNAWKKSANQNLEYACDCPNPNSYGTLQSDGSIKCVLSPKDKKYYTDWDLVKQTNGDEKILPVGKLTK